MTLQYALTTEDHIVYQLYTASKSERIKKQRRNSWILIAILPLLFVFDKRDNDWDGLSIAIFFAICMLGILFFYLYQGYYYKRHYTRYVLDTYKNTIGETATITFNDYTIETADSQLTSKVTLESIGQIDEIKDYFFLQMKQGGTIVIPKRVETDSNLDAEFRQLANKLNIKFNSEPNWKWK